MKKIILILGLLVSGMAYSQAYEGPGDLKINAGFAAFGYGSGILGTVDIGLLDWLSVGGGVDIYFSNPNKHKDENSYLYGRANAHFGNWLNMPDNWDLYGGLNLGILGDSFPEIQGQIGTRYFFNDKLGAYAEIGNHGSLGISFNF